MIQKTFTYENFNGDVVTKDFFFHLSKADFVELALGGEWEANMKKAMVEKDQITIYREFKRLIGMAVGMRSEDGEDFIKTEAFREKFLNSGAFDELIMEIFTSDDMGINFIKGCLPTAMRDNLQNEIAKIEAGEVANPFAEEPAWVKERRVPTPAEFNAATPDQQKFAFNLSFQNQKG